MFFNKGNLKTIVFLFLNVYEKSPKNIRKYTGFVLPDVKIQLCTFFLIFHKHQKNNGHPHIQRSKTFTEFPKSLGFLDFWKIQKSNYPRDSPESFWIFGFWDFLKIVCLLFAV